MVVVTEKRVIKESGYSEAVASLLTQLGDPQFHRKTPCFYKGIEIGVGKTFMGIFKIKTVYFSADSLQFENSGGTFILGFQDIKSWEYVAGRGIVIQLKQGVVCITS
jgi:hypothetical protein